MGSPEASSRMRSTTTPHGLTQWSAPGSNVVLQSHGRASSTSLVAVCDVIRDAGTFDFACHLILDERDRLVARCPARRGVQHRDVLEPDRHATEEDEPVWG